MADTEFLTGNALTVKKWSALLYRQAIANTFFGKFVGKTSGDIIQTKTDLLKEKGDKIAFGLRMKLDGAGIAGDQDIEGNEEALIFHDWLMTINLRGHGVRSKGKMSARRTAFDIKMEAKLALGDWMTEAIDDDTVCALSGVANSAVDPASGLPTIAAVAPSANRVFRGGQTTGGIISDATTDASIDNTNHLFGTALLSMLKRKAEMAVPKIRPVKIEGKDHYVCFAHPYQIKAMKNEAAWLQAQREANWRGSKNPIFSGATGVWDGVIVHEYERVLSRAAGEHFEDGDNATVNIARALFCGAQAGAHAYGQYPSWMEKDFDYGRKPGVATDIIYNAGKTRFNNEDFGVIAVDTAAVVD